MPRMIDAHQHYWQVARGDYGWLTSADVSFYRDFAPADLEPLLREADVAATILVQAAPTTAETEFLLGLAQRCVHVAGVVGWVDFAASDAVAEIERLARNPLLVGLRPMVQDIVDDDWLLSPTLDPAFDAMIANDLCFDALVLPRHLPRLLRRLERHPALKCVIDHCAKPDPEAGLDAYRRWSGMMAEVARSTASRCKLSGLNSLGTERPSSEWRADVTAEVLDYFGSDRVMWGSDWPVLVARSDYASWLDEARALVTRFAPEASDGVFGATAAHFYALDQHAEQEA
jgi:L-fuconolactonase